MKTRNGFISNSSTSSFIVLFPHKPKNLDDLKKMMFHKYSWDEEIKHEYSDRPMTVKQVVTRVYKDIVKNKKVEISIKEAMGGHIEEIDGNGSIINLLRERFSETYSKESNLYVKLREECGECWPDQQEKKWGKHELYDKYLKAKRESEEAEKKWKEARDAEVTKLYNDFKLRYKYHKYEHAFEYGDENGEYVLENGYIFRNLPHLIISNH